MSMLDNVYCCAFPMELRVKSWDMDSECLEFRLYCPGCGGRIIGKAYGMQFWPEGIEEGEFQDGKSTLRQERQEG